MHMAGRWQCFTVCILTAVLSEDSDPPGWQQIDGNWYHDFCANLRPWGIVDLDKTSVADRPEKVLPPGWVAQGSSYIDTVTGDVSEEWPVGFQNEVYFKEHYMRLAHRVNAAWRSNWAEISQFNFRDLPSDFMEVALRTVKAPCLLRDGSSDIPVADVLNVARTLFQRYAAIGDQDVPAKILYIIMGQPFDSYHSDPSYTLPEYMVNGLEGLFENTRDCKNFGFTRSSHDLGKDGTKGHKAQSDLSVVAFVRHFFPDIELDVIDPCSDLHKLNNTKFLDDYDLVVNGHFGPIGAQLTLDQRYPGIGFAAYEDALEKSKAYVWSPPWIVAISNKSHIPLILRKHKIPAVATIPVSLMSSDSKEIGKIAGELIGKAKSDGWTAIFIKPDEQGYMRDLGLFDLSKEPSMVKHKLITYLTTLAERGLKGVCAQKYVASFKKHYEVRLYFFNGRFGTSIANLVDAHLFSDGNRHDFFHWDWFEFEGGILNSTQYKLRERLIPLARRALRIIADEAPERARLPEGVDFHPLFRVDLGCCLDATDDGYHEADGWFVNEAEALPNFNLDHFIRYLVNIYSGWNGIEWWPPFESNAIMTKMVERAAAAWYPTSEHTALELARFAKKIVAARRGLSAAEDRAEL